MGKKGFAVSGMIYTILLLFVMLITMLLFNLQNRKTILDELKSEAVTAVEEENQIELLEARISNLENPVNLFIQTHPIGSIYVTVASDEASVEMMNTKYTGSTWEAYGEGRVLVGIGSNGTTEYATVESTGGSSSAILTDTNLPSHSHVIPSLSVSSWSGSHSHKSSVGGYFFIMNGSSGETTAGYAGGSTFNGAEKSRVATTAATTITVSGQTTTASNTTTCTNCSGESFNVQNPYTVVYMYKRIS